MEDSTLPDDLMSPDDDIGSMPMSPNFGQGGPNFGMNMVPPGTNPMGPGSGNNQIPQSTNFMSGSMGHQPLGPPGGPMMGPPGGPMIGPPGGPMMGPPGGPMMGPPGAPMVGPPGVPTVGPPGVPIVGPPGGQMIGPPGGPMMRPPNMVRGPPPMMPPPPGYTGGGTDGGPPGPPGMGPMGIPPPPGNWTDDYDDDDDDDDDDSEPPGITTPSRNKTAKLPSLLSLRVEKPEELKAKSSSPTQLKVKNSQSFILPRALEEALAFKDQRASEVAREGLGTKGHDSVEVPPAPMISSDYGEDFADSDDETVPEAPQPPIISKQDGASRVAKNRQKKKRKKAARANKAQEKSKISEKNQETDVTEKNGEIQIEYVQENIKFHELEPMYRQFHRIFEAFKTIDVKDEGKDSDSTLTAPKVHKMPEKVKDQFEPEEEMEEKKALDEAERMSKRKLKKLSRLSVAELKQLVSRPDVVEMYDVTAKDPKLLVQLKAHRNTVQVPRHWCYKRKYLQGKRGIEKPAFDLPDFIKKTGIMEMRASLQDKEETKSLKAKMRERARPKLGKIDIDYQKLHDAFFKWQTKPRMTIHGDLYYEGKEFETRLREKKPGDLSDDLRTALGMPVGPGSHKIPPPWLIAQQRYGPPPSYPGLRIPGLNAPLPPSCCFGYHAGGWGKPPVDEVGRPLYGDVFGHNANNADDAAEEAEAAELRANLWGELEADDSEASSSEDEDGGEGGESGEEEGGPDAAGLATPSGGAAGLATPSGMTSIPLGMETPDTIQLRKRKVDADIEESGEDTPQPQLYHVLPERRVGVTAGMMASTHVYEVPRRAPVAPSAPVTAPEAGSVELALDPSELELDAEQMAARYERQVREQRGEALREDLSDMLAEHVARQKTKRKRQQQAGESKQAKKYKEFKF